MTKLRTILDAISRLSMLAAFALLPFFVVPVPWMTTAQSKVALMALLLSTATVSWIVARIVERSARIPALLVLAIGALLPLAYLISTFATGMTSLSLFGSGVEQDTLAAALIWYAALTLSALLFSKNPLQSIDVVRALFLGGIVLALLQILHQFFPSALSFGGAVTLQNGNLLGSWHDLGILSGFFVFLGAALVRGPAGEGTWRYLFAALAAVSFVILAVLNFFDVWFAVCIASLLLLLHRVFAEYRLRGVPAFSLRPHAPWVALIVLSALFVIYGNSLNAALPSAVRVTSLEVRPSWQGTFQIGQQVLAKPAALLFGAGPNTFTNEWGLHKPASVNATPFWNADFNTGVGSIPTSFITVGVAGVLAWAAFLLALLWLTWIILFSRTSSVLPSASLFRRVAEPLAIGVLFLFSFFVFYVPGPALSILSFLAFGLLAGFASAIGFVSVRVRGVSLATWRETARGALIIVFGLILLYAGVGLGRVLASDVTLNRGIVRYNDSGDIAGASALVATAIRILPENDRAQRAAVEIGLLQLQKLIASTDPKDEQSRTLLQSTLSQTIGHGLDAVSIDNASYQNWLELASLYSQLAGANIGGAYDKARAAYSRAFAASPTNPLPLLQMAQLELMQNNADAALRDLSDAVQLKGDFAPAYYLASQVFASQNDFKSAIPVAAQAVRYAPSDPLGWYNLGLVAYGGADYTDAAGALEQVLTLEPQYANAMYVLGLTYYKLGRTEDSMRMFTDLNKLDPSAQAVNQILQNLRAGKAPLEQAPLKRAASKRPARR